LFNSGVQGCPAVQIRVCTRAAEFIGKMKALLYAVDIVESDFSFKLVAGVGFEPTAFGL